MADIVLTCGKHFHDYIISMREKVCAKKTTLTPSLFLLKCMCQARKMNIHVFVLGVSFYDIAIGEEFEDIKGVIRIRMYRRKIDNTMTKRTSTKEQTMIHKTYT